MEITKPTFNNVHNKCIKGEDGKEYWISRAPAVVAIVEVRINSGKNCGHAYVLVNQRGEKTPDYQLHWNLPCGYLDWNETAIEGCIREVYEETGLDIRNFAVFPNPIFVNSNPSSNRQNVVLVHKFVACMAWETFEQFQSGANTNNSEPDEVNDIQFISKDMIDNYKFAFGHEKYIEKYVADHKLSIWERIVLTCNTVISSIKIKSLWK
jgi:ADP-ribose pyrophosphatase YjhB (NUDIX family)